MADRVLISTHDLGVAGALREGLTEAGLTVEFVTPDEDISVSDGALLVLSHLGDKAVDEMPLFGQAHHALHIPVIAVFPAPAPEQEQNALTAGVEEVFVPPATADDVVLSVRRIAGRRRLQEVTGIVGETEAIRETLERVLQIAPVDSTVLVTGESGTGKELVARGIHALSPRRHQRFLALNVAALPDTLLESELFGHEKGAFTGAIDLRKGFFELADGGTIFLDEIGEMPLPTQTKLLRVLEQQEFVRVGGERPTRVNVRIIAATNKELRDQVAQGEFRRDLYYRLNVLRIELPPLRERKDDIPLLVEAFTQEVSERLDRPFVGISDEAMALLTAYEWPGNIRELRNLVESMVVLAPGLQIRAEDIPDEVRFRNRERSLMPGRTRPALPAVVDRDSTAPAQVRPELEFIFRTLVDLRVDMDELRREFEAYRRERRAEGTRGGSSRTFEIAVEPPEYIPAEVLDSSDRSRPLASLASGSADSGEAPVVFRPGMTMDELEEQAIKAALGHHQGNRRRAAEELGIGERTLYRKIQKYDLEL